MTQMSGLIISGMPDPIRAPVPGVV
jgi:hypothetical protein